MPPLHQVQNNPAGKDLMQHIINNTNINLKYENTKFLDFFGKPLKDTIMASDFITRVDECQGSNS